MSELYVDLSKAQGMNRYHELTGIINRVYTDGLVSDMELKSLEKLERDAEDGYYLAADMLHAMDPKDPKYPEVKYLVSYLRNCWRLMDYAATHAKRDNQNTKAPTPPDKTPAKAVLPKEQPKKPLDLNLSMEEMYFVLSLRTPEMRREANREMIAKKVKDMDPHRQADLKSRIVRTMAAMEKERLTEMQMTHLMGFEMSR